MKKKTVRWSGGPVFIALAITCATEFSFAENICRATVSDNYHVDGIPAYSQCAESRSSPVYSNDGVATHTSSRGDGWVRTSWSGGYQCTEFARRYLAFRWDIDKTPGGSAGDWCDGSPPEGLVKTDAPMHGDIIVFAPRTCWAGSRGHVAVVDSADDNSVTIVEQNIVNRRTVSTSCATCFLHVKANTSVVVMPVVSRRSGIHVPVMRILVKPCNNGFLVTLIGDHPRVVAMRGFDMCGRAVGVLRRQDARTFLWEGDPGMIPRMALVVIETANGTLSRLMVMRTRQGFR